jgi:hypothetical protein
MSMKVGRLVLTVAAGGLNAPVETNLTGGWDKDGKRFVVPFKDRDDLADCLRIVLGRVQREGETEENDDDLG